MNDRKEPQIFTLLPPSLLISIRRRMLGMPTVSQNPAAEQFAYEFAKSAYDEKMRGRDGQLMTSTELNSFGKRVLAELLHGRSGDSVKTDATSHVYSFVAGFEKARMEHFQSIGNSEESHSD
ncbi:unnamed protein product [Caenorhabditis sp. 36 PRJEB53466]|nr:unnamed protein product [Caenorhabditis sp. 36 PRJEB53466]